MADSSKIRSFKIESGMDLSITLDIDTNILIPDYAHETARFWVSSGDVLDASDDDDYQAVARYAAGDLWRYLIDGYNEVGALQKLHEQEGWCWPGDSVGITIRDYEIPGFDAEYYEVEVLA